MIPPGANPFLLASDHLRPPKTLADYAAIAICPVLIMLVVGSLVFFLVEIGYAGSHLAKLRWTLFWFVLAMVLVSRIAIEKGYDHAGLYGLGLAAATAFVVTQYVNNYLGAWCILGLIWWATNKLTWDCTVIDDDLDASGEGLLQVAGLDRPKSNQAASVPGGSDGLPSIEGDPAPPSRNKPPKLPWWKLVYRNRAAGSTEPHAPGLWVIYFSLAALPVFGLGQGLIPSHDVPARERAFALTFVYLTAALGLLLLTSFLGLRRYLRQRHLVMPSAISATWVSLGSTLALAILVGCLLLPRPSATWSITAMIDRFGDPNSRAAQTARSSRAAAENPPPQDTTKPQRGTQPQDNDQVQKNQESSTVRNSRETSESQQGNSGENNAKGQPDMSRNIPVSGTRPGAQTRPGFQTPLRPPLNWLKPFFYVLLVVLVLILAIKYQQLLLLALRNCWQALGRFWTNLFGRSAPAVSRPNALLARAPNRPFATFSNPFSSGRAGQMSIQELVVYTFNALEAWAAGYKYGRQPEQTPFEFAARLADQVPDLAVELQQVTRLYVQVAYADANSLPPCQTVLEILWSKMTHDRGSTASN